MNPTVSALVLITKQSLARVRELSGQLETVLHRDAAPTIRALKAECDALSGSLAKLSRYYVDHLDTPDVVHPSAVEQDDSDFLLIVQLLESARQRGFCDHCGGVLLDA
jgi:hypothetical protein